jgi:hypothetical protein
MYCEMIPLGATADTGANARVMLQMINKAKENCYLPQRNPVTRDFEI